jgi:hypothetical protein
MKRSGADLRWRFCFDLVDGLHEERVERADLLAVQAGSIAGEKIGDASAHIDAIVRRTIAQDCVQIVKARHVSLGH